MQHMHRSVSPGKINWVTFCLEIWEFISTGLIKFYQVNNSRAYISTKNVTQFRFPGLSRILQYFPGPVSQFQDSQGLQNDFLKFKDFP